METRRISAAGLVKIVLEDKLLLCLNKSRLQAGNEILKPLGGAFQVYHSAKAHLESLGAQFESGMDLRFLMPTENIEEFEEWFESNEGRETSPYRELKEELVDEERILKKLPGTKVDLYYLHTQVQRDVTDRPGQEGLVTNRYLEVFNAQFSQDLTDDILRNLELSNTHLYLASSEEIRNRITQTGIKIANNSHALL